MPEDHLARSCVKCDPVDPVRAVWRALTSRLRRPRPQVSVSGQPDWMAMTVATWGEINRNLLDIAVLRVCRCDATVFPDLRRRNGRLARLAPSA